MKRFVFLVLVPFLFSFGCGDNSRVEDRLIISSVLTEPYPDVFDDDVIDFVIPPIETDKNIEPDIVLETDKRGFGSQLRVPYPIFDNLEAAIASLKVMQEYTKGNCEGWRGRRYRANVSWLRYKFMMCQIFTGSLVFGDCKVRDNLRLGSTSLQYGVGFTSRALRDAFIASIPHLIDKDEWWLQIIGEKAKGGSYILDNGNIWVRRVNNGKYSSYSGVSLEVALPDDFPVFFVVIFASGLKDEACRRNEFGMRW